LGGGGDMTNLAGWLVGRTALAEHRPVPRMLSEGGLSDNYIH
jgi:hypothetical protein